MTDIIPLNKTERRWSAVGGHLVDTYYKKQEGFMHVPYKGQLTPLQYDVTFMTEYVYSVVKNKVNGALVSPPYHVAPNGNPVGWMKEQGPVYRTEVLNRAYDSLLEEIVKERASLAVFLAEFNESYDMVSKRALQLYHSYRDLRRGRFKSFLRRLKIRPKAEHSRTKWTRPKDASSLWLEYHFGWSPLISDIYAACGVLNKTLEARNFSGTHQMRYVVVTRDRSFSSGRQTLTTSVELTGKVRTNVRIDNPHKLLLADFGVVNPALVLWEIVPFSFVIDWFTGTSRFLSSATDFYGLKLINPSYSFMIRNHHVESWRNRPDWLTSSNYNNSMKVVRLERRVGMWQPLPTLHGFANKRLSWQRAVTSMSLLVSIFTKG
jgi:hypothetical protein